MKKIMVFAVIAALVAGSVFAAPKDAAPDDSFNDVKKRGTLILGIDDAFPPMAFRNESNKIVGYDVDLMAEVARRMGVKFKAQPIVWESLERELKIKKADVIGNVTITGPRLRSMAMTQFYFEISQVVVVKKDSPIRSVSDLKGKRVAVQSGTTAEIAIADIPGLQDSIKEIVQLEQSLMALNDLTIGGVDAVVMDSVVAEYSIQKGGMPLRILDATLASEKYAFACRKTDVKLRDGIQRILEEMAKDGTIAKLGQKWFGSDPSTKFITNWKKNY